MALKFRKKVLLLKLETDYGDDPTPVEGTDAVLASNVTIQPLVADMITRGNIRPTLGGETQIHIGKRVTLDFMVEMAGSGTATTPPAYNAVLEAAAWAQTVGGSYVDYTLKSSTEKSATAYFWQDGIRQIITGIRGSVRFVCDPKGIPHIQFTGTGIYARPTAVANPTPTLTAFQTPVEVSNTNSTFSLHSYAATLHSLTVDQGNSAAYMNVVGSGAVEISDRMPTGQCVIREPALADKDYWSIIDTETLGAFSFVHGTVAGNICTLTAPSVQILNPTRGNDSGFATLQLNLSFIPSSAGDDELKFRTS
jgi:hypothetical protein